MQMRSLFLLLTLARMASTNNDKPEDDDASHDSRPRIVGGTTANIAEFPFLVSIRKRYNERRKTGSGHFCGGSLISQRVLVTAGHCCYEPDSYVLRPIDYFLLVMGNSNLELYSDDERKYGCQEIKAHCSYNPKTLAFDIALMLIDGKVPDGFLVQPIAINDQEEVAVGAMCHISGWGFTSETADVVSKDLRSALVPILDNEICVRSYYVMKIKSQICAGYVEGKIDACQGDSGGPLKCGNVIAGVVSYGGGCARKDNPGVYQSIFHFSEWIKEQNNTFNYTHIARSYHNKENSYSVITVDRYCLCLSLLIVSFFSIVFQISHSKHNFWSNVYPLTE